jgi:DNA-directed RNA polymerase specialized sigma24 family protein
VPLQVKPFLFQIARNLMIDRLREQNVVSLETMADFDWLNVSDDKPSSEAYVAARQELRLLQAALDELPPRCRPALTDVAVKYQ